MPAVISFQAAIRLQGVIILLVKAVVSDLGKGQPLSAGTGEEDHNVAASWVCGGRIRSGIRPRGGPCWLNAKRKLQKHSFRTRTAAGPLQDRCRTTAGPLQDHC